MFSPVLCLLLILRVTNTRARYSLRVLGRSSSSIKLQFPDSQGGVLMYVESQLAQRSDPPWESLVILQGNDVVSLTGLRTETSYRLRWRTQSKVFADVQVETMARFSYEVVASSTSTSSSTSSSTTASSIQDRNQQLSEVYNDNNSVFNTNLSLNSTRKVRQFNVTTYNGTNQYEPRLLSRISRYNYSGNSSLSNILREMTDTDTDTQPTTKITIPDNIFVSTNSNNGLVYNIRNKLWYPSTTESSQYQYNTRHITASSKQQRNSKEQFSSEFVTKSTYFPIKLTTTMGIERSRSYRREKNSDNNEKYSTPGKIFGDRVVQSADIQVITQKTSAILSIKNYIKSRDRDMIGHNLSS